MIEVTCEQCRTVVPRRSPTQRYCAMCSELRDMERKRRWAREHPPSSDARRAKTREVSRTAELARLAGSHINASRKMSMAWDGFSGPDLLWQVGIAVPFSYAASKNHIYAMRSRGHVALRSESRALRDEMTLRLRSALAGRRVAHNKLWIDILVQKPDHRGDAVNVVDLVCDAVKAAVTVDDRWFSLRRLDWEIVKDRPQLFLKVGQETDQDCQVCSHCGQIRSIAEFTKRRQTRLGIDRVCRMCRRQGRSLARAARKDVASATQDE
jgi:hypothetical protein